MRYYNYLLKTEQYHLFTEDGVVLELLEKLDVIQLENQGNFWLITFNPPAYKNMPEHAVWQKLIDTCEKSLGYKNLLGENYIYVLEQRSDDYNHVYGLHAHLLVQCGVAPRSQVVSRCHNAIQQSGLKCQKTSVDVRLSDISRLGYLLGDKQVDKIPTVNVDRQLRGDLGFENFYSQGFDPDLLKPFPLPVTVPVTNTN